jgi:hypothetical protein
MGKHAFTMMLPVFKKWGWHCHNLLSGYMRSNYIDCIVVFQGTEYNE